MPQSPTQVSDDQLQKHKNEFENGFGNKPTSELLNRAAFPFVCTLCEGFSTIIQQPSEVAHFPSGNLEDFRQGTILFIYLLLRPLRMASEAFHQPGNPPDASESSNSCHFFSSKNSRSPSEPVSQRNEALSSGKLCEVKKIQYQGGR